MLAAEAIRLDQDLEAEALQVDDDENSSNQIHDVGELVLHIPGEEKMKECYHGTFELRAQYRPLLFQVEGAEPVSGVTDTIDQRRGWGWCWNLEVQHELYGES